MGIDSAAIKSELVKINESLRLYELAQAVSMDYEIWFVGRKAQLLKFYIQAEDQNSDDMTLFFDKTRVMVTIYDILNNKVEMTRQPHKLSILFDHYSAFGRFFKGKHIALKYLYYRVLGEWHIINEKATNYINKHPESLL